MIVQVDNIWSTPSALYLRVTVWPNDRSWRKRFDKQIPVAEIAPEALHALMMTLRPERDPDDTSERDQLPLF